MANRTERGGALIGTFGLSGAGDLLGSIKKDEAKSGLVMGAAAGAQFGPIGAAVGAVIGVFSGMHAKRKRRRAERRLLIANTKIAMEVGEGAYSHIAQSRERIASNYEYNIESERARIMGSGGTLEGTAWEEAVGRQVEQRDSDTTDIDDYEQEYRESDAYKLIQKDHEFARTGGGARWGRDENRGKSVTGEDYYTKEQRAELISYGSGGGYGYDDEDYQDTGADDSFMGAAYREYKESTFYTMDEFEQVRFGTDEQKEEARGALDARIKEANTVFEDYLALDKLEKGSQSYYNNDDYYGGRREAYSGADEQARLREKLGYTPRSRGDD